MRTLVFASLATAFFGASFQASAMTIPCNQLGDLKSLTGDQAVTVVFKNGTKDTVVAAWIGYAGETKEYWRLAPGESKSQKTFVSHPWAFAATNPDRCIEIYMPEATENSHVIKE